MNERRQAPRNTATQAPIINIFETAGMFGGSVEEQESRGQAELARSQTLPTSIRPREAKAILESAGIKFIGPVDGDPKFQYADLPEGWKIQPTDHSMWSDLLDHKGRKRASIFYKAAFYDRDAFLNIECRYTATVGFADRDNYNTCARFGVVKDGGTEIFRSESFVPESDKTWEASDSARAAADKWLAEHFPDAKDPAAYWD